MIHLFDEATLSQNNKIIATMVFVLVGRKDERNEEKEGV